MLLSYFSNKDNFITLWIIQTHFCLVFLHILCFENLEGNDSIFPCDLSLMNHKKETSNAFHLQTFIEHQNLIFYTIYFLSATEYHSDADYNSRRVGVVVVVVVVVVVYHNFKNGPTFECLDRFASYLGGSCTGVRRFRAYACVLIRPPQPAQPAYHPKSEKRA